MKKIGLLSDTHGYLDDKVFTYFDPCDEIWHAGDIGELKICDQLAQFRPFRAVFGNIDDHQIRVAYPEDQIFELDSLKVWMTHIGGYPLKYSARVSSKLPEVAPKLFICGHSHILKVMHDPQYNLLYMNPGAAGRHGFHYKRTLIRFDITEGKIQNLEVVELGKRAS